MRYDELSSVNEQAKRDLKRVREEQAQPALFALGEREHVRPLKLPAHVPVARDIAETGNTSAASIPLAMSRMLDEREAPHGGLALQIGFGAGLVYAAQVVVMP